MATVDLDWLLEVLILYLCLRGSGCSLFILCASRLPSEDPSGPALSHGLALPGSVEGLIKALQCLSKFLKGIRNSAWDFINKRGPPITSRGTDELIN